jgi:hypothetical protein
MLQAESRQLKEVHDENQQTMKALQDQETSLQQMAAESDAARQELQQKIQMINNREATPPPPLPAKTTFHRGFMLALDGLKAFIRTKLCGIFKTSFWELIGMSPGAIQSEWMCCSLARNMQRPWS